MTEHSTLKALIVEDVKIAQKMAVMELAPLHMDIDVAGTGAQALELLSEVRYDLVFMDLGLPDMDGLTITQVIRNMDQERGSHTTVVALTAHTADKYRKRSEEVGVDAFFSKPLELAAVVDFLKSRAMIDV